MMHKILGRIASARSFVFAAFALAMSAASAFDTPYLTFRSPSTFSISVWSPKWDGTMEYSTDKANWTTWTGASISAAQSGDEYFLYLRGTGNSIVASTSWGFTGSGELVCEGDIETLRDYNGNPPPMGEKCYWMMFYGCTQLTVPPVLSATTLAAQCYNSMFQGCTSLKAIPALPATGTLPNTCYFSMFSGCSSLVVNTTGPGVEWSIPTGTTGEGIWNYSMFVNTGGDFTGNPVAGTTYYVASALPPGLSVVAGAGELAAYTGASVSINLAETIKGGVSPYAFSGTVPTGLTLNPNGTLSGSVATAGSYPFTLRVTDATSPDALTLDAEYTLVVTDPAPLSAQSNLGKAKVGKAVNIALAETISGGVPPYTFAVTASATLPTGFSLTDGVLSGTAAAAGTLTFAITATDALGTTQPASYTIEAVESAGFTDDDPEEPASGVTVDCLTPDGVYPRTCNQIASSASTVTWDNSWYYVTGNVTLSAGAIVNGKVSLILGDGATLTVQGASNKAGIGVTPGNTLSIYCQRGGSGKLIANGGTESAGIGGDNNGGSCGKVTIYGGDISAIGGSYAAGIGGGDDHGNGGIVTVYGGSVRADGGSLAAGIGGGWSPSTGDGTLTVSDNVVVKAGTSANPTAELSHGTDGSIAIVHGSHRYFLIEAVGPVPLAQTTSAFAAYIDEPFEQALSGTVSGGTTPYAFSLKSGTLPTGLSFANGIVSGTPTAAGTYNFTLVVTDDVSDSIEADYTLVVREVFGITYKDQDGVTDMPLQPSVYTNGIGVATLPRPTKAGWAFVNWYDNAGLAGSPVTSISSSDTGALTLYSKWEENLSGTVPMTFLDADGSTRTENCVVIDATTTTLDDGWYVVANDVTPNSKSLTVSGHARLVLRDGKTLTLTGANNKAGIEVTSGNALTIYGQSLGTGALSAKGMYGSAGIGGSRTAANCGTVTINGGTVAANGGDGGAGIGGGKTGNGGTVTVNGGTVTATGFTALPGVGKGDGGADHGTLQVGAYMSVTVGNLPKTMSAKTPDANGFISLAGERYYTFASVRPVPVSYRDADGSDKTTNCVPISTSVSTLSDGWYAVTKDLALSAGLMVSGNAKLVLVDGVTLTVAGYSTPGVEVAVGNSLTIYGQVDGTGALIVSTTAGLCAGIGAGNGVAGGAVTINGGSVQATGGDSGGAGIGGGSHGAGGTVVINGGSVVATGGGGGAGIGGGQYGAGGTVTVNGGTVTATSGTTTGSYLAAGIGCGLFGGDNQGSLIVASGLTVHAGASADPAGVPSRDSVTGSVTLGGEPYYVITESSGAAEYGIVYMSNGTPLNLAPASYFAGTGVAELPVPPAESTPAGRMFGGWYANDDFSGEAVTSIPSDAEELKTFYAKWVAVPVPVTYIDGNGDPQQASCIVVNEFSTELTNGWYVLEESLTFTSSLTISGDVKLVLKDGKTLMVTGTNNRAGVVVMGANALTLYAQSIGAGAGALVARGNNSAAGIGGNEGGSGGSVTIYGGNVTATGGDMLVPGIGGGWHGASQGTLTVAPWLSVKAGASADPEEVLPKSASGVVALANRQYYKVVEASRYNITYMDGANVLQNLEPSSYAEGAGATLAAPAAASGFAFVGWYTNATFAGEATMNIPASASGDKTFYAKWAASESTPYVDANGDGQTMDCVVLTADMTNLVVGSYVAKGTLAFGTGGITVAGDVTIVLADGAQMSVAGGEQKAGISVPAGCSLTIYAQTQGTGALDATGGNLSAGIGGDYRASAGTVTVYGGTVTATGDSRGVGGGVYAADNGRLVLGPGMLAKAGFDALHVDLLPANETTGEVIVSGDSRYFRIEKSEEEILPLTQVTGTFDATNGINVAWTLADTVCYGTKPYSFALKAGSSLPDGFTFEDGVISGAPTASGNYPFTMVVTDGASPEPQVLEATYTIRASANPNQLTQIVSDLPDAIAGFEYYQALGQTIEGGKRPYTFVQKEAMGCYPPSGIKLKGAALSGIPTDPGRITTVTLVVTDANGLSTEATYNLNIEPGFVQTFTANGVEWKFALFSNPNTHQDRVVICDNNGPAIDRATEGAIVIPSSYGRTSHVACLGDMAFYLCTNLTSVTIPNGVLAIGDMAFASCSNLVSVRIPSSVVQMGDWVFDESGLETVYVDPGDIARVRGLIEGTDYDVSGLEFIEVCDVAFNANYDGGAATTNMMRYGQSVGTLPVLAREHYTFLGWFTAAEGGEQISAETQVAQNATYYAHWAIDTFTVTFAKNDGTDAVVESRRVAYGERVGTLPADPTRDGYTFFHWWTEPGNNAGTTASAFTTVTADVTYYAHWNPRSYTVRFLKNDGTDTVVRNLTTSYGQTLGTLPTPTRDGYTLAGWFTAAEDGEQIDSSTLVEGDVDYYAHWTPDSVEDWPEDTSTVAGQTAGEAFEITGDLAGVNAKTLADWAKGAGNVAYGDKVDIIPEAFMLNCANTAAAVTAATPVAQEAIKITAITIVNAVPQLTYPATYGNGQVVLQGSANIGASASWHDGKQANDRFFKTVLKP